MLRGLGRLFGSRSGRAPENEVWDKLVAESEPGIREAGDVISGLIDRAGGLSVVTPEAQFPPWEADRLIEEIISGAERELEEVCGRYDYWQLLFLSRLCAGVPPLRSADADMGAVRVRVQNADRWVLRCGDRSLDHDYMGLGQDGISIGKLPESIFRGVSKLHWLANFHQWRIIDHAMFNFVRLVSQENGLTDPRLILRSGGAVGRDWGSRENWASVNLYAHRYRSRNGHLAWWALGDAEEPEDGPYTLTYGYSPVLTDGSYGGGELFIPVPLRLGAMMEYGKRFRPIFEREDAVGMLPEHLRAISRGLARLVNRENPKLPNVRFFFNRRSESRKIDVPLRRGEVLIAIQTWARNFDRKMSEGQYRVTQRRWEAAKRKLAHSWQESSTGYSQSCKSHSKTVLTSHRGV